MAFSKHELSQIGSVVKSIVNKLLDEKLEDKFNEKLKPFATKKFINAKFRATNRRIDRFKVYVENRFDKIDDRLDRVIEKMATTDDLERINEKLSKLPEINERVMETQDRVLQTYQIMNGEYETRWKKTKRNTAAIAKIKTHLNLE